MRKFSDLSISVRDLELDLEGMRLSLQVVSEAEQLLDRLLAKGDDHEDVRDERIPYWAELWPSAHALGRFLIRENYTGPGTRVTEMGCGLGVPGIVAGKLGAEVTFSDYLPDALAIARHNWERNVSGEAKYAEMDWRSPDTSLAADLLLASDVAYEERAFKPLPDAFRLLCKEGGKVLVSEPDRAIAKPFFENLSRQGFSVKHSLMEGHLEDLPYRVNIYELQWTG